MNNQIVEEKSIFHTRMLRDTNTNAHFVLALLGFMLSLGVAVCFLEL